MMKKDYLDKKLSELTVREASYIFITGFIKLLIFILAICSILFLLTKFTLKSSSLNDFNLNTTDPIDTYLDYDENLNKIYC